MFIYMEYIYIINKYERLIVMRTFWIIVLFDSKGSWWFTTKTKWDILTYYTKTINVLKQRKSIEIVLEVNNSLFNPNIFMLMFIQIIFTQKENRKRVV